MNDTERLNSMSKAGLIKKIRILESLQFTKDELAYLHNGLHDTGKEIWLFDSCPDIVCKKLRERIQFPEG